MKIELIGEGKQVRNLLFTKYGPSYLDIITKEYDPLCTSIPQYLKGATLKVEKFKVFISVLFQEDYEYLIDTYRSQIDKQLNYIRQKIFKMSIPDNWHELSKACLTNKFYELHEKWMILDSMLLFVSNNKKKSFNKLTENIEVFKSNNMILLNYSELILLLSIEKRFAEASNIVDNIELDSQIILDDHVKYRFYRAKGYYYNAIPKPKYTKAKSYFMKAAQNAPNEILKGESLINVVLMLKEKQEYKEALKYSTEALDIVGNDSLRYSILNNMASIYNLQNDIEKAVATTKEVIRNIEKVDRVHSRLAMIWRYLDIMGVERYLDVLDKITIDSLSIYEEKIADIFEKIINELINLTDLEVVEKKIIFLLNGTKDTGHRNILIRCLGMLALKRYNYSIGE